MKISKINNYHLAPFNYKLEIPMDTTGIMFHTRYAAELWAKEMGIELALQRYTVYFARKEDISLFVLKWLN